MLESTYNVILIFAIVSFITSALISVFENLKNKSDSKLGYDDGSNSAYRTIFMGFAAMLFLVLSLFAGNITNLTPPLTSNTSCIECTAAADPHSIYLYGILSFVSFCMLGIQMVQNFISTGGRS